MKKRSSIPHGSEIFHSVLSASLFFPLFPHLFGQMDVNLIVVVTSAVSIKAVTVRGKCHQVEVPDVGLLNVTESVNT